MFNIKGLLSSMRKSPDDGYVPASALIEEGSVLDRRKDPKDRRVLKKRRKEMSKIVTTLDRRKNPDRRKIIERRCINNPKTPNEIQKGVNKTPTLNRVDSLVNEQHTIIEIIRQLAVSAELMNFKALPERLSKLCLIIKAHMCREEETLHAYTKKMAKDLSLDTEILLKKLHLYIFNSGDHVVEILQKYATDVVTEQNVQVFLEDLQVVTDILVDLLQQKEEHLYDLYHQIPDNELTDS